MNPIMIRYLLTIIILVFIPKLIFAEGFEYRGFKQGMNINEAEVHANSLRGRLMKNESHDGYDYFENNDHKKELWLNFCNGEKGLYSLSYIVHGGFLKYVKIIENFKRNGLKIIGTDTRLYLDQNGKDHASLSIWLGNTIDEWNINIALFGQENYDTTNFQVTYGIEQKRYCKQ